MRKMKKFAFKKYLNKKINQSGFEYLEKIKFSHSKVKNISYRKLKIAPYLKESTIPIDKKQLIFALRTSMINVKANFGTMFGDTSCDLCGGGVPQTQQHLMVCPVRAHKQK